MCLEKKKLEKKKKKPDKPTTPGVISGTAFN